jgi:hypothetical protein
MSIDSFARRTLLVLFAVLFAVCLPRTASAKSRALVVLPEGSASPASVAALETELADGFTIRQAGELRATLGRWSKANLVGALAEDRRQDLLNEVARAALAQGIDGVLLVEVRTVRHARSARLVLIDPRDALSPFETETKLATKADATRAHAVLAPKLAALGGDDVDGATPLDRSLLAATEPTLGSPGAPAPAPKDAVASEDPPRGDRDFAHALFVVEPHVALGTRHFDYVDRITAGQRPYNLTAAPMVGFAGAVYPFALMDNPVLEALGVVGEYGQAVGLKSATSSGDHVWTSWSSFDVALRGRIRVTDRVCIGIRAGYGEVDYSFPNAGPLTPELPAATYGFLEAGVDARVEVWKLALVAGIQYLDVQSASGVADRYPHASIGGIDAMAGIGVPFAGHFEARTGVRYQRFFYSMHPMVGEASVAGGATDEYGRWDTSVAFHY